MKSRAFVLHQWSSLLLSLGHFEMRNRINTTVTKESEETSVPAKFCFTPQKCLCSVTECECVSEEDCICRIWAFSCQRNGYSALISSHSYSGPEAFASPTQSRKKASFATPLPRGLSKQHLLRRSLKNTIVTKGFWASL